MISAILGGGIWQHNELFETERHNILQQWGKGYINAPGRIYELTEAQRIVLPLEINKKNRNKQSIWNTSKRNTLYIGYKIRL